MIKKFFLAMAMVVSFTVADMAATEMGITGNTCMAAAPNDGTYTRTSSSVSVYTESGHPKGSSGFISTMANATSTSTTHGSVFRARAASDIAETGM